MSGSGSLAIFTTQELISSGVEVFVALCSVISGGLTAPSLPLKKRQDSILMNVKRVGMPKNALSISLEAQMMASSKIDRGLLSQI